MKRILSFILISAMLFSLASCSSSSGGSTDDKTPITSQGNIAVNLPDTKVMYTENFSITDKMVAYHLKKLYMTFCESLAELGLTAEDLGIITGTSLSSQVCSIDDSVKTWLEYFANQAEYSFMEQLVLCEAANAAGIVLDDDDKAEIDAELNALYDTAHKAGKAENAYISELYGSSVNAGDIREALEFSYLAEKYLRHISDNADVSKNALENYYAQHSDKIDTADFLVYVFSAGEDEYAEALAEFDTAEEFLEYTKYHAVNVQGLTEEDYEEVKSKYIVCENIPMDEDDSTVSFAFSAEAGEVNVTKNDSGAITVVMVTRPGSRNEALNEDGIPMWEAEVRAMIENAAVDTATEAAANKYPVTVDRQTFYSIDIEG